MKINFYIIVALLFLFNEISFAQKTIKLGFTYRTRTVKNLQIDVDSKSTKVTTLKNSKVSQLLKIFPASAGENLEIDIDPGNIKVSTWDKNKVSIEVEFQKKYELEIFEAKKIGNTIKFEMKLDCGWNNKIKVKVKAPSKFNFDLKTTGGYIKIQDAIRGKLLATTEGGNIRFNDVYGKVDVSTNGGNIKGKNVEGNVKLQTNGGNISIENVNKGKTNIETFGGNIRIGNVASDLVAKTHGGHISIENVGGNAEVVTLGGHITMDKVSGSVYMKSNGGHLNLKSATGNVIAKTLGGHIKLKDISGSITASTKGGNIYAILSPKLNTESILETSSGNIELRIPGSAKTTIDVSVENQDIDEDGNDFIKSDFPSLHFDVDDGEIDAIYILNGGGSKVLLDCSNGKVKIRKWNK